MKLVVYFAGVLFVAAGVASIWSGYDIIQVERGWTQVIAGAVILSGGVVTLAIGVLIDAVNRMHATVSAAGEDFLARMREEPTTPAPIVAPPPAPAAPKAEAAIVAPEMNAPRADRSGSRVSLAKAPVAITPPPVDLDIEPPRRTVATAAVPPSPPRVEPIDRPGRDRLPSVDDVGPALDWLRAGPARPAQPRDPPAGEKEKAPALVDEDLVPPASTLRRFESGGVNYTLFADGSILAESTEGREKFANMDALRKHLASRDQLA